LDREKFTISSIAIACPLLNKVFEKGELTRALVGRKYDGIYIGFRKSELEKLEKVALENLIKSLKKLEKSPSRIKR